MGKKTKHHRVVLVGLDGAGKTTIMRQLTQQPGQKGPVLDTLPTIGFTAREISRRGVKITVFDIGGQAKIRELWPQYCHAANGIVVVADCNDHERLSELRTELFKLVVSPTNLSDAKMLVLANKQDQPHAIQPPLLEETLALGEMQLTYHVQGTVGIEGTGIDAGFDG